MNGIYSFGLPCLRARQFAAFKNQNGVPGFLAPYSTRYLTVDIIFDVHYLNNAGSNFQDSHFHYSISIDRMTNQFTGPDAPRYLAQYGFPYYQALGDNWTVTDDRYQRIDTLILQPASGSDSGISRITTTTVQLSNLYTLDMLDADAIIANLMAENPAWGTVLYGYADEHQNDPLFNPGEFIAECLPDTASFNVFAGSPPTPLKAVAWDIWKAQVVSPNEYFSNNYSKLVTVIAMAGNYCLKTYEIDADKTQLSETCLSGTGSCANTFTVHPPAPITGQNVYTMLVPNCQCI